jgi:putative oxidoreductase
MFKSLMRTDGGAASLFLRLALGIAMFPHGAQKMFGWFGGYGFSGTMNGLASTFGLPTFLVFLVIITEFFGSLGLIFGFLTRLSALAVGVEMLVAALMVHVHNGFFMNWTGAQKGEGFEYHILAVAIALALVIKGGGALSIDGAVARK